MHLSSALLVFCTILVLHCSQAAIVKRNATTEETKECPGRLPCGWFVYNKNTRIQEFFMNNTCICSTEKQCVQTDDDLSVGAYVYRCLDKETIPKSQ